MAAALPVVAGGRALLFERLVLLDHGRRERVPFILHDRDGLRSSLRAELEALLSTRLPVAAAALAGRQRSTVDYGIPDGALTAPGDPQARAHLAAEITAAIRAFEPRLAEPAVSVRLAAGRADALVADISGFIGMDGQREPVCFALTVNGQPAQEAGDA